MQKVLSPSELFQKVQNNQPHLSWLSNPNCLVLLYRAGSRAYNCHTETSDDDYRGVFIPPKEYYLGFNKKIENIRLSKPEPDVDLFELTKFFKLTAGNNPNVIESLWIDPEDLVFVSKTAESLINERDAFLSKKIYHTFRGYAVSQLHRLKLHKDWFDNPIQKAPERSDFGLAAMPMIPKSQLDAIEAAVFKEVNKFNFDFLDDLSPDQRIGMKEIMQEILVSMKVSLDDLYTAAARNLGANDNLIEIMKQERLFKRAQENWKNYKRWCEERNPARAELEAKYKYDTKHAYHCVRLMKMCEEILTTKQVIVKRPDREELLFIRNGGWTFEQLENFMHTQDEKCKKLYEVSNLPHGCDLVYLDNLCVKILSSML